MSWQSKERLHFNQTLLSPDDQLRKLHGIGSEYEESLEKLGITTIDQLLHYYPSKYEDYSQVLTIDQLRDGTSATIYGQVHSQSSRTTKKGNVQVIMFRDTTGNLLPLKWYNQEKIQNFWDDVQNKVGEMERGLERNSDPRKVLIQVAGKCKEGKDHYLEMVSPNVDIVVGEQQATLNTGRLVPHYHETERVKSRWLRKKIGEVLDTFKNNLADYLPEEICKGLSLMPYAQAIRAIHFPDSQQELEQAQTRLAFDELFFSQLFAMTDSSRSIEYHLSHLISEPFDIKRSKKKMDKLIASLPFPLTPSQLQAHDANRRNFALDRPTINLVSGDVGSGKTILALLAAYEAYLQDRSAVFMAPSLELAHQHYRLFCQLLEPLGVKIGLVTANDKPDPANMYDVFIGTIAVNTSYLPTNKPRGVVIIDEEQRFGTEQRQSLQVEDSNGSPIIQTAETLAMYYARGTPKITSDTVVLSATPQPRTQELVERGVVSVSTIEKPENRKPIDTRVITPESLTATYERMVRHIEKTGEQAFIISPIIKPSKNSKEVTSVSQIYADLQDTYGKQVKLGMIHAQLPEEERIAVMNAFRNGEIQVLVASSIIEVGIDVPNATIMIITSAEKFGLAQLHQFRGRVGRGPKQSYCVLCPSTPNTADLVRLSSLRQHQTGWEVAKVDKEQRGFGDPLGTNQSGKNRVKLEQMKDETLIRSTTEAASWVLGQDKTLDMFPALKKQYQRRFG